MENTETKKDEKVTDAVEDVVVGETPVVEETKQEEVKTTENIETPAETTEGTAEEVVVETDTTQVTEETEVDDETIEKVNTGIDHALQERLDAQLKEIENLKKEMAKLRKANEFTSTGGSHQQNNKGGTSYSDGDINNFRWKI